MIVSFSENTFTPHHGHLNIKTDLSITRICYILMFYYNHLYRRTHISNEYEDMKRTFTFSLIYNITFITFVSFLAISNNIIRNDFFTGEFYSCQSNSIIITKSWLWAHCMWNIVSSIYVDETIWRHWTDSLCTIRERKTEHSEKFWNLKSYWFPQIWSRLQEVSQSLNKYGMKISMRTIFYFSVLLFGRKKERDRFFAAITIDFLYNINFSVEYSIPNYIPEIESSGQG